MQGMLLELLKVLALAVVALLCMLTGFVAATKGFPSWQTLFDKTTLTLAFFYLLPNFMFLAYRQMFSSPQNRENDATAMAWVQTWIGVSGGAMVLMWAMSPVVHYTDLLVAGVFASPLLYYCYKSYQLYQRAKQCTAERERQHSFENLIFIPAFLLCIVNFAFGLILERRLDYLEPGFAYLRWEHLPYLVGSFIIIGLFYKWRTRAAYIYAAFPLAVITFGLLSFYLFGGTSAKFLALAIMITFFLGFGEVAKHLYFIETKNPNYVSDPRGAEFYLQGANWSGVVYPTVFLASPAIFPEMSFVPIIGIVYFFVLFWLAISTEQKKSKTGLVVSFLVGYGTPIAFMLSLGGVLRLYDPPLTDQTPFQTLLALIALIGIMAGLLRLAKDLFGLNLVAFVRNIWNRQLYSNEGACLFLLLSIGLIVTIVLTCAWLILFIFPTVGQAEAKLYSTRLALVGVAVVVLCVLAVLITIFRPKRLADFVHAIDEINTMKPATAKPPERQAYDAMPRSPLSARVLRSAGLWLRRWGLLVVSGRVGVSWIAGLAAAAVVYKSSTFSWFDVFAAFVSLTLVTMSGFIMNDIYDRDKDRQAGKTRPITRGQLSISGASAGVGLFVLVAITLCYLAFGISTALWISSTVVALFIYSPVARHWPLVKGVYTAGLAITPFLVAYEAVGLNWPATILLLLLLYVAFREIVLDAVDVRGDIAAGIHTIAAVLGAGRAAAIGWAGMLSTLLVSFFYFDSLASKLAIALAIGCQVVATLMFVCRLPYSLGVTRVTLLSGVIAVALGA